MTAPDALLEDWSFEITSKDAATLADSVASVPAGTQVNVTSLPSEDVDRQRGAVRTATGLGLVAVPHLAARRLGSQARLVDTLRVLTAAGATDEVFVVAGDGQHAEGPFDNAYDLIRSGAIAGAGLRRVGFGGYPEGHPHIDDATLWDALERKTASALEQGLAPTLTTQLAFDAERVLDWVAEVRDRGLTLPVRIGVAGPVGARRLLGYATRFGVASSAGILRKYGLSVTNLFSTAGPEHFLADLHEGYDVARHGNVALHFYTFGGVAATADWIAAHRVGV